MRQNDFHLVRIGTAHAEALRSLWLDMLAGSPGVYHERLDEAMAMSPQQWQARAASLNTRSSTAFAIERQGRFIGIIAGYVDNVGAEVEGQLSTFHISAAAGGYSNHVATMLLEALAAWLIERDVYELFIGIREDRVDEAVLLLGLGFVPTGSRRPSELDPDYAEVELVCLLSGLASDHVLLPTRLAGRAPVPGSYRYRVT